MMRSLPPLGHGPLDERAPSPLPPIGHDISRPSSASQAPSRPQQPPPSHHIPQVNGAGVSLPGMSALASVASAQSPPMRPMGMINTAVNYPTASPTPTSVGGQSNSPPVCQNCQTSTTPLWRRDEVGSVLCNACGLFLKLHGRPRPISLKTDVIKSRNRVKSSGQALKKAQKQALMNGNRSEGGTPPPVAQRRVSHKSSEGSDRSNSPISRTNTPGAHPTGIPHGHPFDPQLEGHNLTHSPSLPSLSQYRQTSPGGSVASVPYDPHNPHSYEALHQSHTQLKTRVSELEVINGLFKGRVQDLERLESQQRAQLDASRIREQELQRRIEDLERQLVDSRKGSTPVTAQSLSSPDVAIGSKRKYDADDTLVGSAGSAEDAGASPPYAKRSRPSDVYPEPPQATAA